MSDDVAKLKLRLEEAFSVATRLYQSRGFQRRLGFGRKPALVNVDLANAWTRPGNPFTCDDIDDQIIPGVQRLLEACRANNHLVVLRDLRIPTLTFGVVSAIRERPECLLRVISGHQHRP